MSPVIFFVLSLLAMVAGMIAISLLIRMGRKEKTS